MERKQELKGNEFLPKRGNPQHETVTYEIGGTFYEVSTSCGGSKLLNETPYQRGIRQNAC